MPILPRRPDDDAKIVESFNKRNHPYVALAALVWRGLPRLIGTVSVVLLIAPDQLTLALHKVVMLIAAG